MLLSGPSFLVNGHGKHTAPVAIPPSPKHPIVGLARTTGDRQQAACSLGISVTPDVPMSFFSAFDRASQVGNEQDPNRHLCIPLSENRGVPLEFLLFARKP